MDTTDTETSRAKARAELVEQLTRSDTRALIALTEVFGDELLRRAQATDDTRLAHALRLAVCNVVETRARLRLVRAYELDVSPPAVLSPDRQHGAEGRAAPVQTNQGEAFRSSGSVTNASTAGGSTCSRCLHSESLHTVNGGAHRLCMALHPKAPNAPGVYCDCTGFVARDDAAPSTPSPRSSIAAAVAARAEGADGEGGAEGDARASSSSDDRGELGKDLSRHLAVLKGGAP